MLSSSNNCHRIVRAYLNARAKLSLNRHFLYYLTLSGCSTFLCGVRMPKTGSMMRSFESLSFFLCGSQISSDILLCSSPPESRLQDLSETAGSRSFQEAPGRKKQNALRFCQRKRKSELPAPAWDRGCVFGLGKQSHISCRTLPRVAAQAVLCYGAWIPLMKILGLRRLVNREQEGGGSHDARRLEAFLAWWLHSQVRSTVSLAWADGNATFLISRTP